MPWSAVFTFFLEVGIVCSADAQLPPLFDDIANTLDIETLIIRARPKLSDDIANKCIRGYVVTSFVVEKNRPTNIVIRNSHPIGLYDEYVIKMHEYLYYELPDGSVIQNHMYRFEYEEGSCKDKVPLSKMPLETMFPDEQVRALARAAGKGRIRQIEKIANQWSNVNSRGTQSVTPLFWALINGNMRGFKKLLKLGADPNIIFGIEETSVIHSAVEYDRADFLEAALKHGGNPNLFISGPWGGTPLFRLIDTYKSRDNKISIINTLLKYGAD